MKIKNKTHMLQTPVAFFVYNRPDLTWQVFQEIRLAKPSKLLVVADGPNAEKPEDNEKCRHVRQIIDQIDWPCELFINYSDSNMGCNKRMSSGLNWVFEMVSEVIILEDDCVPHQSFFYFCEELLEKYRNDERVMHIGGCNFQDGVRRGKGSYYFSIYNLIWGWASWRRAWKYYDVSISTWRQKINEDYLLKIIKDQKITKYWAKIFDMVKNGEIDTWDYQWIYAMWLQNGLAIQPQKNMISNIGYSHEATHTKIEFSKYSKMKTYEIGELNQPDDLVTNHDADIYMAKNYYLPPSLKIKIHNKIRKIINPIWQLPPLR
jgi:hypothetical protein